MKAHKNALLGGVKVSINVFLNLENHFLQTRTQTDMYGQTEQKKLQTERKTVKWAQADRYYWFPNKIWMEQSSRSIIRNKYSQVNFIYRTYLK